MVCTSTVPQITSRPLSVYIYIYLSIYLNEHQQTEQVYPERNRRSTMKM